jgi:hypothetical protein
MRSVGLAIFVALALAAGASAEVVAPGVQDGMLAVGPSGTPFVGYVRGSSLMVASRASSGRWHTDRARSIAPGSTLVDLAAGVKGPVALVQGANDRTLVLVRRSSRGWRATRLARQLPPGLSLGWPGLVLDRRGLPAVAYTRWNPLTRRSGLMLVHLDPRGRVRSEHVTALGFPQSDVAPPARPVIVGGKMHVIETYGYGGLVGTIDWYRRNHTWEGLFLDAVRAEFPVGPLFAAVGPRGTLYAAWSESLIGDLPVSLAVRGREVRADFILDRALTTGLAATPAGPEVAANEWVASEELGLPGEAQVWAGQLVGHRRTIGLDGWIAGLSAGPGGSRELLLGRAGGLSWFRSPRPPTIQVSIAAAENADGSVALSGRVRGAARGRVTVYRERPGAARQAVGTAALGADGSFSLADRPPLRPLLYRAVYTAPATGIPYAALLREPVS